MKIPLLVSDANVLIDLEEGKITKELFALPYHILIPDVLFEEELKQRHSHLLDFGLEKKSLQSDYVSKVFEFSQRYSRPSKNDLFALCLALQEEAILLTGDRQLCEAADNVNVLHHGTIWLVAQMIEASIISLLQAENAFEEMLSAGSRLPVKKIKEEIQRLKSK